MILGIQIIGVLFALFMGYLTFLHKKRKEFSAKEYLLWNILWAVFIIIVLFPRLLNPFIRTLNISRTMDLLILLGFIFIIGLTFHNYSLLKKNQRKLEWLVRKMAFKEVQDKK